MDEFEVERFMIPVMIFLIPITAMLGAFVYLITRTLSRSRVRELEIRERIAMIERGLVPSPEADPTGFERALARHERTVVVQRGSARSRGAGVIVMGLGLALILLIAFAGGEPGVAIGVGGALMVLGLAFFLNSLMSGGVEAHAMERYAPPPPPAPRTPATPAAQPEQRLD